MLPPLEQWRIKMFRIGKFKLMEAPLSFSIAINSTPNKDHLFLDMRVLKYP
jgi:hypothetical protein